MEHFLAARRSMYQQIYYHATVRGSERLLRAVFERACDPSRPKGYKKETTNDIPKSLHTVLRGTGDRPTLDEFIATDDTTIIAALKRWGRSATDPVLSYLARSLFNRCLFKEVRFQVAEVESVRAIAKDAVRKALKDRATSDLPAVDAAD